MRQTMLEQQTELTRPLVLAFDTSGNHCSVALYREGILYSCAESMVRGHSEVLLPMISAGLTQLGLGFSDIGRIAVSIGPGAFTGVRIGISAARGLSLALGKPSIGVCRMHAVAAAIDKAALGCRSLVVVIDTKRQDFYFAQFNHSRRLVGSPCVIDRDTLARNAQLLSPCLVAGDAAAEVKEIVDQNGGVAELAAEVTCSHACLIALCAGDDDPLSPTIVPPRPQYLRGPDTGSLKTPIRTST